MENVPNAAEVFIARGQIVRLQDATGCEIRVQEGCLWITQEREGVDHLVKAGQSFRIDRPELAIVSALRAARVRLIGPLAAPALQLAAAI